MATERDGLGDCFVATPVDFWNQKVRSYLQVIDELKDPLLVRYEDLISNPVHALASLATCCKVASTLTIPEHTSPGWKQDPRSYSEYRQEVIAYDPCQELGVAAFKAINASLDLLLLERTGYVSMIG